MLYSKNLSPPLAVSMPMIDVDAEHVITYARTQAGSDSDRGDPLEAGNEADTAKASDVAATAPTNEPMNVVADSHKRGEADSPIQPGSPKKQRVGDDQPTTPRDDPSGERAPKTARLEESPNQQRMLQVTSTDLSLYEHEDSPVKFDFSHDDVDEMERYDMEFYDDQLLQEDDPCFAGDANMSKIMDLTQPKNQN